MKLFVKLLLNYHLKDLRIICYDGSIYYGRIISYNSFVDDKETVKEINLSTESNPYVKLQVERIQGIEILPTSDSE